MASPLVRYVRVDRRGANYARNHGVELATSDWISFQDSDDCWRPDKLEKQVASLQNAGIASIDACFCQVLEYEGSVSRIFPNFGQESNRIFDFNSIRSTGILVNNIISTQTLIMRRSSYFSLGGFDVDFPRFQDWDLAIRIIEKGSSLFVPEALVFAEKGADSITKQKLSGIVARKMLFKKYFYLYKTEPTESIKFLFDLATRAVVFWLQGTGVFAKWGR